MLMPNYKAGSYYIIDEISSQAQAWSEIIALLLQQREAIGELFAGIDAVIFTGCGSALNASFSAAPLFQILTGIPARAIPAAEIYLYPNAYLPNKNALAVLLSRSGKTTEVLRSLDFLQGKKIPCLGITCSADSPLAQDSDLALLLTPASERAVATTRSFTGMILAAQMLCAFVAKDASFIDELHRLPDLFSANQEKYHSLGKLIGTETALTRHAFVANGPLYGCARECQLKVKEMTLLPADAYPMFDFRHGPQSNVSPQMLVTVFLSDSAQSQETAFLRDMHNLGGVVWGICENSGEETHNYTHHLLELSSNLSELARLPLYLPAVQYMAYYRSLSLGLNPDEPQNLSYWINTLA
jgi:glutamine---fructose-6-phosphate transaminase (isomerizing)